MATTLFDLVTVSPSARASTARSASFNQAITLDGVVRGGPIAMNFNPYVSPMTNQSARAVASVDEPILDKLLLTRYTVDLGYLLTDQELTLTAWNSDYRRALTITSVDNSDPDGITISGSQGLRLSPGAATSYSVRVRVVGKYKLDDRIRFAVAELGNESPEARIVGTRLVVFPLSPEWSVGVDEELSQDASVLTTYSGVEQRAQLRDTQRRKLGFTVAPADETETGLLEAFLWAWQSRVFGVPEWQRSLELSSSAGAGAEVLACDTRYADLVAGDYVMVYTDSAAFEVSRVAEVTSTTLRLSFALTNAYAAGARVIPVSFARLNGDVSTAYAAAAASSAQLSFTIEQ